MIKPQVCWLKGTLYMSIPCKEGLVICADKRTTNLNSYFDFPIVNDNTDKIHRLDKTIVFLSNGCCSISKSLVDDETNTIIQGKTEVLFDANYITQKFYAT